MANDDMAIVEALDAIDRKRDATVRAQVAIVDRLASLRTIVQSAAEVLRRQHAVADDPQAALGKLSWQLHEERVRAEAEMEQLRRQLEALAEERASRLSELTPSVGRIVAQLVVERVRPLVATVRAGRCSECSSEARPLAGPTPAQCRGCRRFVREVRDS